MKARLLQADAKKRILVDGNAPGELRGQYRLVTFDFRNHGKTTHCMEQTAVTI
jgi:pimeloyl-ACP methyl ester carboxylesterase